MSDFSDPNSDGNRDAYQFIQNAARVYNDK